MMFNSLLSPWRALSQVFLGICLLVLCVAARAAECSGGTMTNNITSQDIAAMRPPRDAPLGSTIYTQEIDRGKVNVSCSHSWVPGDKIWFDHGYRNSPAKTNYPNVYETGIPGIGMRIYWHEGNGVFMQAVRHERTIGPWEYTPLHKFTFELVKIGEIKTGVSGNQYADVYYHNHLTHKVTFQNVSYTAVNRGCKVARPFDTIRLPDIHQSMFTQTSGIMGRKSFNIDLSCDKGVKVAYRIDGINSTGDFLVNDSGSDMAEGVVLALLQGDVSSQTFQKLGTRTEFKTSQTTVDGETLSIPLTVGYVGFNNPVKAGKVSTSATVTFFYE